MQMVFDEILEVIVRGSGCSHLQVGFAESEQGGDQNRVGYSLRIFYDRREQASGFLGLISFGHDPTPEKPPFFSLRHGHGFDGIQ